MNTCWRVGSIPLRIALLTTLATSPAVAQADSARVVLIGTVRDTSGAPLERTRLTARGLLTLSDSLGRFILRDMPAGPATLAVRRLGFEPLDMAIEIRGGATQSVAVVMTALPQDLPGMTTSALLDVRLSDFYRHRQSGIGFFITRQEIEDRQADRISDILRRVPGTRLGSDRTGRAALRIKRSGGGRDCPPDIWVDGVRATGMSVDDVPLTDVEALEMYRGPAGLPPEMNNRFGNPACGALVIWTRLPG